MIGEIAFDHLHLNEVDRRLMSSACKGGAVAFLAPLDKGLSGSSVWQARWRLSSGSVFSKHHVFKIGKEAKIKREFDAIQTIASVIEPGFPQVGYFPDTTTPYALLRQEFIGTSDGEAVSLRSQLENTDTPDQASKLIYQLYFERMKFWHPPSCEYKKQHVTLRDALDWWVQREDIHGAAEKLGVLPLNRSLKDRFGTTISEIAAAVERVLGTTACIPVGPIHGDLHSQNVLLDGQNHIQIIDFGWTNQEKWKAIDFLMMECSLRFLVTPPNAYVDDLLKMEELLDSHPPEIGKANYENLRGCIYGRRLEILAEAIHAVRHCAHTLNACTDRQSYRLGLITLTAGLSSIPSPINRVYLLHSLAYQLSQI